MLQTLCPGRLIGFNVCLNHLRQVLLKLGKLSLKEVKLLKVQVGKPLENAIRIMMRVSMSRLRLSINMFNSCHFCEC